MREVHVQVQGQVGDEISVVSIDHDIVRRPSTIMVKSDYHNDDLPCYREINDNDVKCDKVMDEVKKEENSLSCPNSSAPGFSIGQRM